MEYGAEEDVTGPNRAETREEWRKMQNEELHDL